ncbi:helix-turn-helix transcriptional regulator [Nonomuraea sp. NPDC050643]|uniref:helix-turn-helix domain-containing protein n=1 Tax=Nonomuraea sp. NPDC050643 TaxID=3155660 RepID=UPI0033FBA6FA
MPPTKNTRQHGPAIRALREKDGLSVEELAARVDMHPQSLRNVELERRPISHVKLNLLARALRVDTAAISRESTPARGAA